LAGLGEELKKLPVPRQRGTTEIVELRDMIERVARRADGRLLLVLDQFEEFTISANPEAKESFVALISSLRSNPIKGVRLVLVLRSDYETALADVGLPLLRQDENWIRIGRFYARCG
jgi:hypothetical protein